MSNNPASTDYKRVWVRYEDGASTQPSHTQQDLGVCAAQLHDISSDCVSLIAKRHMKVGGLVTIDFGNVEHQARVISAVLYAGERLIQFEFTDKLSDEELSLI